MFRTSDLLTLSEVESDSIFLWSLVCSDKQKLLNNRVPVQRIVDPDLAYCERLPSQDHADMSFMTFDANLQILTVIKILAPARSANLNRKSERRIQRGMMLHFLYRAKCIFSYSNLRTHLELSNNRERRKMWFHVLFRNPLSLHFQDYVWDILRLPLQQVADLVEEFWALRPQLSPAP